MHEDLVDKNYLSVHTVNQKDPLWLTLRVLRCPFQATGEVHDTFSECMRGICILQLTVEQAPPRDYRNDFGVTCRLTAGQFTKVW